MLNIWDWRIFSSIQVEFTVRSGASDKIETTHKPTKETDLCDGNSHEIQGKLTSKWFFSEQRTSLWGLIVS